ncbi:MAG: sulfite exporter TauE/SafE family protein [Spirochaetes bacterium]|nr:sulfite exporter TauE/SafE family protein [Spirochaetota bacterium]
MNLSIWVSAGSFLISIFIGLLIGIFGVGGGFLLTPVLMIVLGISGPVSVGTSLATILVNSTFGLFRRRQSGTVDVKMSLIIGTGSIGGVYAGTFLLEKLKNIHAFLINGNQIEAVQIILLGCFFLLLAYILIFMTYDLKVNRNIQGDETLSVFRKIKIPPYMKFNSIDNGKLSIVSLLFLGLLTGLVTGFLGVGGGIIMIPVLIYLLGLRSREAAGTSLLLVWISSFSALFHNISSNNINLELFYYLTSGGLIGTFAGTKIGLKISGMKMKVYFIYIICLALLMTGSKIISMVF